MLNFERVYVISFVIYVFVLVYVVIIFRILKHRKQKRCLNSQAANNNTLLSEREKLPTDESPKAETTDETGLSQTQPLESTVSKNFFKNQLGFLVDTWKLLSKPRANDTRFIIISLLILFYLGYSLSMGLLSLQYLYLVKKPIQLSQVNYGYFKAANTFFRALALLIVLPILKRVFKMPDYVLFVFGFTSEFLNLLVLSFSYFYRHIIWLGM